MSIYSTQGNQLFDPSADSVGNCCTKSTHAIGQNWCVLVNCMATKSLLSAVLPITHGKRAFAQSNEMKSNQIKIIKLIKKQVLKVRKDKQSEGYNIYRQIN